jgi:protease II
MLQRYPSCSARWCQVPLLDMKRYSHLLAGASWMAEYGDPDTARAMGLDLAGYSPYQNLRRDMKLPKRAVHHQHQATTACTPATPARWPRRWKRHWATRRSTTRTSRAATAARPTTRSPRT